MFCILSSNNSSLSHNKGLLTPKGEEGMQLGTWQISNVGYKESVCIVQSRQQLLL